MRKKQEEGYSVEVRGHEKEHQEKVVQG